MIARCRLLVPNWRVVYISLIKTTTPFSLPSSGSLAAIRRRGGFNQIESIYTMYWYTVKSINDFLQVPSGLCAGSYFLGYNFTIKTLIGHITLLSNNGPSSGPITFIKSK